MKRIDRVEEDIIKISSDVCLSDIYSEIGDYELLVEPLSEKQLISDFIYEGGMGFNSLSEGSLVSKIFKFKGTAFDKEFEYGLDYHPLYNVGYTLHRLMTKRGSFRGALGTITELTLPIQPKKKLEIEYLEKNISDIFSVTEATNVMYVTDYTASIMGLEKGGVIATYLEGMHSGSKSQKGIWEKRFIEDGVPVGHHILKVLTVKSNVGKIHQVFREETKGLFAVLLTNIGPLVVMSVEKAQVKGIMDELSVYPMTYLIGQKE